MTHDPCFLEEVAVTLLDPFDGCFEHVLRLTVHTHADRQPDLPATSLLEQGEEPVARWVGSLLIFQFLGVSLDIHDIFLFELVWMILCPLDNHQSFI